MIRGSWSPVGFTGMLLLAGLLCASPTEAGTIIKTNDRKFPVGTFCPLESRSEAGADLSFVAGGNAARITFEADNLTGTCDHPDPQQLDSNATCVSDADCPSPETCARFCSDSFNACATDADCSVGEHCGNWSQLLLDNVTLLPKSVFDAHLLSPSPFYEDCYFDTPPPGQTTGGLPGAPSYDHLAGDPESYLELFDDQAAVGGWSGDTRFVFASAPRNPAGPDFGDLDTTGGSLGVGAATDGNRSVSASLLVTGLTPGQEYVIFGWWSMDFAHRMTLTIENNACPDGDGDGHVICNGCELGAGEACGDCDDANPHCSTNCTDADGDGYCPPADCDDLVATCTEDCVTDLDGDGVPFCRDTCQDPDGDGYGTAGGAGSQCAGPDCLEGNPLCGASCVDGDGDQACPPADCDDADAARRPGLAEVNDCADQQCPGEPGFGVADENSGTSEFVDLDTYSWPAQSGATLYQAVRSSTPDLSTACAFFTTASTSWVDPTSPAPGEAAFYANRPLAPCGGSWGQDSALVERAVCPGEICTNGIDDDGDSLTDCADPDCGADPACQPAEFHFVDGPGDDITDTAFGDFLQPLTVAATDWFYFEIDEQGWNRNVAWCAERADFYRTAYLENAFAGAALNSGTWNRWYRGPSTANAWVGPSVAPLLNEYGDFSFGTGTWCSEQFPSEPRNCLFPNRVNDCELYDLATGACAISLGEPWTVTIRIAATRLAACGF